MQKAIQVIFICCIIIKSDLLAHCQVPCGIYDDALRVISIQKDFETINIEDGIKEVGKVLKNNGNSFVVHGEPQSGKTEFMIALTCYLLEYLLLS